MNDYLLGDMGPPESCGCSDAIDDLPVDLPASMRSIILQDGAFSATGRHEPKSRDSLSTCRPVVIPRFGQILARPNEEVKGMWDPTFSHSSVHSSLSRDHASYALTAVAIQTTIGLGPPILRKHESSLAVRGTSHGAVKPLCE